MIKGGKGASCQFHLEKILGKYSDWLSLGHVPFPGPMTVVSRTGYYDWSESESHVQACGQEGREHCWTGKLPQLPLVFLFSRQKPCLISSSLRPSCGTETNVIFTCKVGKDEYKAAEVSTVIHTATFIHVCQC